jgi:hypothetical protein
MWLRAPFDPTESSVRKKREQGGGNGACQDLRGVHRRNAAENEDAESAASNGGRNGGRADGGDSGDADAGDDGWSGQG